MVKTLILLFFYLTVLCWRYENICTSEQLCLREYGSKAGFEPAIFKINFSDYKNFFFGF